MSPYENVIVGNSFEEIVFSNRNKAYGAYFLRKKQKKYIILAFGFAFLFVTSLVLTPMIYNHMNGNSTGTINKAVIVISQIDTTLRVIPPEPPKININPNAGRFIVPQVVAEADTSDNMLSTIDDYIANNTITAPPSFSSTPIEVDPIDPEPQTLMTVSEPAMFNGGDLNEFNKWVAQNLKYPQLAIENQIQGKVIVQFVVNTKGKIETAAILRGVDPSLDEEAKRVILSSPLWTPPKQNGRPVKQLFTLPVAFKLQDN
jgi:periplasmic protein TonB